MPEPIGKFQTDVIKHYVEPDSWMESYIGELTEPETYTYLYEKMAHMVDNLESDFDNA